MSTITAFNGSFGSTSPVNVPSIRSYWPTVPKLAPPGVAAVLKVGASVVVIVSFVIRACAAGEKARNGTPIKVRQQTPRRKRNDLHRSFITFPPRAVGRAAFVLFSRLVEHSGSVIA